MEGSPSSILRRCLSLSVDCHSFSHFASILSRMPLFRAETRRRNLCVALGLTASLARLSAISFLGLPL
jgi:hypothetical protein